jgi:signal transduction histidine kinase
MLYKGFSVKLDAKLYKLILYNLIQNGLKFGKTLNGDLVLIIDCKPSNEPMHQKMEEKIYMLETWVIDTGNGIERER